MGEGTLNLSTHQIDARCVKPIVPELRDGWIHVWSNPLDVPDSALRELLESLCCNERDRAHRFVFASDRRRFIAARGTLRALLGAYLKCEPGELEFAYGAHGKPALAGHETLQFNVAHSQGVALYAFTRNRAVGVDIERTRPIPDAEQLAGRFFSPEENSVLQALEPAERDDGFLACWTRKEAYIKATGSGLSFPLDAFTVSVLPSDDTGPVRFVAPTGVREQWSFRDLCPYPGYRGAVVARGNDWRLSSWGQPVKHRRSHLVFPCRPLQ